METTLRVLLVEDSESDALFIIRTLEKEGYALVYDRVDDAAAMNAALQETTWDVILCDYQMPQFTGLDAIALVKASGLDIPLIIVSGVIGEETAVEAMKAGAADYVMKDNLSRLLPAIDRELRDANMRHTKREAEEALRESEELFRSYLEYAPDGIYMSDLEGTFLYGNRKCEEITGYRREELIGKNFLELDILPEKHLNLAAKLLQANMEGRTTGPDEIELISKEGRLIPVEINTSTVQRMGQRVVLAFARDITERKQAEAELFLHVTLTQALLDLHLMATESQQAIMAFVLETMQKVCQSQFSFIGLMDETESFMTIHAWSKDAMAQCSSVDEPIHFPISEAGIWGDCVRQRKPLTFNDYEAPWPSKKGYPEGHVPIRRFLSVPIFDGNKIVTVVSVANKKEPYKEDDVNALISLTNKMWEILRRKRSEEKLQQTLESLSKALNTTIQVLVSAVEARDPYTAGHQQRVADLSCAIATELGFTEDRINGLHMAGVIHDLGKLSIPSELLAKPTKLTTIEFALIKEHSRSGYEMLKDVESPWPLAQIAYQHHERMDGSGYPQNLKGDEILMEARIMAVADVVESMASHRPYRPALGIDAALEEIERNKGILYDDAVAEACLKLFREKGFQL